MILPTYISYARKSPLIAKTVFSSSPPSKGPSNKVTDKEQAICK